MHKAGSVFGLPVHLLPLLLVFCFWVMLVLNRKTMSTAKFMDTRSGHIEKKLLLSMFLLLATAELPVGICRATGFLFAEVKERVQLYLYSPSGPSWPVLGWTLHLPLPLPLQAFYSNKVKAVPEDSKKLRFPDFKIIGTWRWQRFQPDAPAAFTPRKYLWYSFMLEAESTPGTVCGRKWTPF
jgi:hypothetical protein